MATIITVFSGKGGTGKSFIASNIACGFSMNNYKTLLIDFSFGVRNDDVLLGVTDSVLFNVGDVLNGECKADEAIIQCEKDYIPDFLAASPSEPVFELSEMVSKVIKGISQRYDYIIFDCTVATGKEFRACKQISDMLIAVCGEDSFSVNNTALCTYRLKSESPDVKCSLVINNVKITSDENDISAEQISDITGLKLVGIVPYDDYAYTSMKDGDPLVRYDTVAGRELEAICSRITGKVVPYNYNTKSKKYFWKK